MNQILVQYDEMRSLALPHFVLGCVVTIRSGESLPLNPSS